MTAFFKCIVPLIHFETPLKPDVCGTGTLVKKGSKHFILTAAHVVRRFSPLFVPTGTEHVPLSINWILSSTARDDCERDPLDYAIAELGTKQSELLRQRWTFVPDNLLDGVGDEFATAEYAFTGYPTSRDRVVFERREHRFQPRFFIQHSVASSALEKAGFSPHTHIGIHFKQTKNVNEVGLKVSLPKMEGVSGGAIWRVCSRNPTKPGHITAKLAGLATDRIVNHRMLVGVRIGLPVSRIQDLALLFRDTAT